MDYMITALIMPISSLLVAVFVGWIRQKSDVFEHMCEGSVPQAVIALWLNALRFPGAGDFAGVCQYVGLDLTQVT